MDTGVKGLDLCERFFRECGLPQLQARCGEYLDRMTIGLVGDGSDCLGFDDELSRDHDWGPGFCIWLNSDDYQSFGAEIQQVYDSLPDTFDGFPARTTSTWGEGRVGVFDGGEFYRRYLGRTSTPDSLRQWLMIPENALASATNGRIFHNSDNDFSHIRADLLKGYPESVRLKKIAARCMQTGQAGQYNYPRMLKRKADYAAMQALAKYCESLLSLIFLLNNRYLPFYKWAHQSVQTLPILGRETHDSINELLSCDQAMKKAELIEIFSSRIIDYLRQAGLSDSKHDFLPHHGPEIQKRITDKEIAQLNPWAG